MTLGLTLPALENPCAQNPHQSAFDPAFRSGADMRMRCISGQGASAISSGHSSGGGCATLLAFDVARGAVDGFTATDIKYVTTFGSPRVGDPTFAAEYDAYNLNSARVTHYQDVVVGWVHHRRLL